MRFNFGFIVWSNTQNIHLKKLCIISLADIGLLCWMLQTAELFVIQLGV